MKSIFKIFRKKDTDSDFLKQLRKDLVIEIIRKRATESSPDSLCSYKLSITQETELLVLYITGKATIDPEKLIAWYNSK